MRKSEFNIRRFKSRLWDESKVHKLFQMMSFKPWCHGETEQRIFEAFHGWQTQEDTTDRVERRRRSNSKKSERELEIASTIVEHTRNGSNRYCKFSNRTWMSFSFSFHLFSLLFTFFFVSFKYNNPTMHSMMFTVSFNFSRQDVITRTFYSRFVLLWFVFSLCSAKYIYVWKMTS